MMTINKLPQFLANIKAMDSKSVFVGVPAEKDQRNDGTVTNAMIAAVQEFGSEKNKIPARPFLIPAIKTVQPEAIKMLREGAIKVLHGEDIEITLNKVGLLGQSKAKDNIVNGSLKQLEQSTIIARQRRRKNGAAGTKPLIDTGQLLASIIYVVRKDA